MTVSIREIIKKSRGSVDYLEIRHETIERFFFSFSNDRLVKMENTTDSGYYIRACHRGGWGFTSFNSDEKFDLYLERTIAMAKKLGSGKTRLAEVNPVIDHVELKLIEDPRNVSISHKIKLFESYIDLCRSHSALIKRVKASYMEKFRAINYVNTDGTDLVIDKMEVAGAVTPFAVGRNLIQFITVTDGSSNNYLVVTGFENKLKKACETAVKLLDAKQVVGGKYTVILDPVLAGTFVHEAFGHMSEADDYNENKKMKEIFTFGRQFGSKDLTIYDTGLDVGSRGYIAYDDEGVPAQKTILIENGILTGRLHSRESAAFFNEKPTGNARTISYRYPPICRMRNTCIANGKVPVEDLFKDVKEGVYALDTHGGTGGEMFSFDAGYGYMIRDGKIEELVRDVQLSGNLFKTLKNITAIASDFQIVDDIGGCGKGEQYPLETSCSSPHIKISDVTVGGTNA